MYEEQGSLAPSTVRVIDDDDSFRNGMVRLLAASGFKTAGHRCVGDFLLSDSVDRPGCILLDMSMPGPSGMELLEALQSRPSAPPVIFVTGYDDVLMSVNVMKAGAFDYIVKPAEADRVLQSVSRALRVDAQARSARREIAELRRRFERLSPAERTIFRGIANNKLNKQLAAELGSCERTIKTQRARIRSKLRLRSLPDLVRASKLLEECDRSDRSAKLLLHEPVGRMNSARSPERDQHSNESMPSC